VLEGELVTGAGESVLAIRDWHPAMAIAAASISGTKLAIL
jgi:lambda repressor-like predicted transcriptional regulator